MNEFLQLLSIIIVSYICAYGLISRICTCIEHCATAKTYGKCATAEATKKKGE